MWANLNAYLRDRVDKGAVQAGTPIFVDLSALWHCCCQSLAGDVKQRLIAALLADDETAVDGEAVHVVRHLLTRFFNTLDYDIMSYFCWTFLAEDSSSQLVLLFISHICCTLTCAWQVDFKNG